MKILLLGHNGYLGSYLHEHISSDVLTDRGVYDNGQKYDYIINCIGKISLEYCESNPQQSYNSNVQIVKDITTNYPNTKIITFMDPNQNETIVMIMKQLDFNPIYVDAFLKSYSFW